MVQSTTIDRLAARAAKPARPSILLIEDNTRLRDSLGDFLEDENYEVDKCVDADEAFVLLESGYVPDLILVDVAAPMEEGWLPRVRRLREAKLASVPVVVLSADTQRAGALERGADALLQKPVQPNALLAAVTRLLRAEEERAAARALERQRLSSLGGLSTGVANELNNPVTFVVGNLELARNKCHELAARLEGGQHSMLQEIERLIHHAQRGASRVAEIVHGVSTAPAFARAPEGALRRGDLRQPSAIDLERPLGQLELTGVAAKPAPAAAPQPAAVPQQPSVLVVDDEMLMCELLATMLADDYQVVALSSAREALTRMLAGESFDLVLCDLMMPDLTGMDLYAQLSRERPEQAARMVFMTGGTFTDRAQQFLAEHGRVQLQKPFRHEELLSLVKRRIEELARSAQSNLH